MDHIGSAHNDHELVILMTNTQQIINKEQYNLRLQRSDHDGILAIQASWQSQCRSQGKSRLSKTIDLIYRRIGLDRATSGDCVHKTLVAARIIHVC